MDRYRVTDLTQECIELFNKESFLCFFSFRLTAPGKAPVSGLCKVARPKRGTSKLNYLALVFIIDTPDGATRRVVEATMKRFEEGPLQEELPELKTVVSIPAMESESGIYLKQLDLILRAQVVPDEHFIAEKVYPAILKEAGFEAEEMVWWDDLAELRAATPGKVILEKTRDVSFGEKLRRIFGVKHD